MVESLQDGVSEESVTDTLKDFQINGKKISKKALNLHLSKAIEIVSAMQGEDEDKVNEKNKEYNPHGHESKRLKKEKQ